jgi:flagellar biosynthetic protein FliS
MNIYAKQAHAYLAQRALSASPEQQAALIMEAGQQHLGRAIQAFNRNDSPAATSSILRVSEVLQEAFGRLNLASGGEAAIRLKNMYLWWGQEISAATGSKDTDRLAAVAQGMGEIRQAWEQLHEQKVGTGGVAALQFGDRVG